MRVAAVAIIRAVTEPKPDAEPPCLALPVDQAAAAIGISENHFRRHVLSQVRSIKLGRVQIVPVIELERWLHLSARFADEDE